MRSPRQLGKTTLLNHLTEELLAGGVDPKCIFRAQFDDLPALRNVEQAILGVWGLIFWPIKTKSNPVSTFINYGAAPRSRIPMQYVCNFREA